MLCALKMEAVIWNISSYLPNYIAQHLRTQILYLEYLLLLLLGHLITFAFDLACHDCTLLALACAWAWSLSVSRACT
jgi:hypothetical protein